MKNRMKKTFALILALVMCLSLMAVCSFAAENEEPVYDVSGSKTASPTMLTAQNDVTTVTLQLPSGEYQNKIDIVLAIDSSSSTDLGTVFINSVTGLFSSIIENNPNVDLKVGVVLFTGRGNDAVSYVSGGAYEELTPYNDDTKDFFDQALRISDTMEKETFRATFGRGSSPHGGLDMADEWLAADTEVEDNHKYVVLFTDGKGYIWNDEENVPTTIYSQYYQWKSGVGADNVANGGKMSLSQTAGYNKGSYSLDVLDPANKSNIVFFSSYEELYAFPDRDDLTEREQSLANELTGVNEWDQKCTYALDTTTPTGNVNKHPTTNGVELFGNKNYQYWYEWIPDEAWEDVPYLQINPYDLVKNEEGEPVIDEAGKATFDTETINPYYYQYHFDCLQKGLYKAGHLWTDMGGKYNLAVVTHGSGTGGGLELVEPFKEWLRDNSDYSAINTNATAVAEMFTGIDNNIRYMVSEGVVTDVIPADFTLENADNADGFRMTLNGEALDVEYVEADGTWGFGVLNEGVFPYVISYNADTQTITWTLNVPVENLKPVTLSYDLKLTDEAKATVSQGSSKDFDTNVSAVLKYITSDGDKGEYPFEIPVVTYSVPAPPTPTTYTVTYVDGLGNTLERFPGLSYGEDTPVIDDPTRTGYVFTGWDPEVSATVKKSVTYTAQWAPLNVIPIQLNGEDHFAFVKGYPDGTVRPENNITRAETATMFYRLLTPEYRDRVFTSSNDFSDVAKTAWFNKAVSSMANGEFILGYPDGTFMGDKSITRAEFVTVMVRFLDAPETADNPFSDVSGHWAEDYITAAVAAGWVDGYPDGTFKPDTPITRAEAMKIINTVLHRGVNETSELGDYVTFPDNRDAGKWYYYEVIEATNDHEYNGARPDETWTSNAVDYVYDIAKYENP